MLRVSQQEQWPGKGSTGNSLRHFSLVCIFTIDNYQLARLCNDVRVQNQSWESWTFFLCKNVLLFQYTSIAAGHVSENALLIALFCLNVLFPSMYRTCDLTHKGWTRFWNFVIDQLANICKVENHMNYIGKQSIQALIKIRYLGPWLNQVLLGLVFTLLTPLNNRPSGN